MSPLAWAPRPSVARVPRQRLVPLYRSILESRPDDLEARRWLATLLWQLEQIPEVLALTGGEDATTWESPALANLHGQAALALGRAELAVPAFRWAIDAGVESQLGGLAHALRSSGRHVEALDVAMRAVALAPHDWEAGSVAARELLQRDDRGALWRLAMELVRGERPVAIAPSALAHAATTRRQRASVADLVEPDVWLSTTTLSMCADERDELVAGVFAHAHPEGRRVRRATNGEADRVEEVHLLQGRATTQLLDQVRHVVDRFVSERIATHGGHPVLGQAPETVSIEAWALDVRHDGHEGWHLHPGGWLSGVVYLDVPDTPDESGGAIDFGPLPLTDGDQETVWATRRVHPRPGDVLVFPSSFAHRTWPTNVDAPRRCIAFDVRASNVVDDVEPAVGT